MLSLLKRDNIAAAVRLAVWLLVAEWAVRFITGIVLARLLGPGQYGVYALGHFLILITVSVASLGIPSAFGRYTPRYEAMGRIRWFLRKTFILNIGAAFALGLLVLLRPGFFSDLIYGDPFHTVVMMAVGLSVPALVIVSDLASTFSGLRLFRASATLQFSRRAVYGVLGIALVAAYRQASVALLAYAMSMLMTIPLFVPMLSRYLLSREPVLRDLHEPGFYKRLLRFTAWFAVTPILVHLFHYVDRLSIQRLMTSCDQGVYSAAINLCAAVSAAGLAVSAVLYRDSNAAWERGEKQEALKTIDLAIRSTSVALTALGSFLVLLARPVILLLLGSDYSAGADVLPMLVVFHLLAISALLYRLYPMLTARTYVPAVGLMCALPMNVMLNLVLIPQLGITGAALATMLSHTLMWATVVAICRASGMPVSRRTFGVSLLPFLLLLPKFAALGAVAVMLYVSFGQSWIISERERRTVYSCVRTYMSRLRGRPGGN